MTDLLVLTAADVRRCLPMPAAIEAMKSAFAALSSGAAIAPPRIGIEPPSGGVSLFMPAYLPNQRGAGGLPDGERGALAVKVVSVFDQNRRLGLPMIHAVVLLIDERTGVPKALLEGAALTAIRTGAASGAATDLLARRDAKTLAVFGTGVQARTQIEAVCAMRTIETMWLVGRSADSARQLADELQGQSIVPADIRVTDSPGLAIREADVVCTATNSSEPVFAACKLRQGTHVNAIGSFKPQVREVDTETVRRAYVVVDSYESALAEAGDLLVPLGEGAISRDHIRAELGQIVLGTRPGRTSPEQITLFKSCGLAVQDAAAADLCYREAIRLGIGQRIPLS